MHIKIVLLQFNLKINKLILLCNIYYKNINRKLANIYLNPIGQFGFGRSQSSS